MADEAILEILKQGAKEWNEWRRDNPDITVPILSGADLSRAILSGADLSGADLINAKLRSANLQGADLEDVNLAGSLLLDADLRETDLQRARLSGTDLRGADLRGADLRGADLLSADVRRADLRGADMAFANLGNANLRGAYLDGTHLRGAELSDADLTGASLRDTNFCRANLYGADLSRADLTGANVKEATVGDTAFVGVDLSAVEGLETLQHMYHSEISVSTIYRSKGQIPEVFLQGCGMPESFIVQTSSLVAAMQPIQFYSCFISYSSKDEELAQRLHADLQSRGVRCWFAPEDLKIGERFRRRIDEVIRVHDKLLLILSAHSVASSWVEKEVETAMESEDEGHRTMLFPVRLDNSVMEIKTGWPADVRRTRHIGDFRRWKEHDEYQKAFARLLADLKASA